MASQSFSNFLSKFRLGFLKFLFTCIRSIKRSFNSFLKRVPIYARKLTKSSVNKIFMIFVNNLFRVKIVVVTFFIIFNDASFFDFFKCFSHWLQFEAKGFGNWVKSSELGECCFFSHY